MSQDASIEYVILPLELLDNTSLEEGAKVLFARLLMFKKYGKPFPSKAELAHKQQVCGRTIDRWLSSLENSGFMKIYHYDSEKVIEFLKSKIPQKIHAEIYSFSEICSWCQGRSFKLHNHHYPISKKDGGLKTVRICANCHQEFHFLVDENKYAFPKEFNHE